MKGPSLLRMINESRGRGVNGEGGKIEDGRRFVPQQSELTQTN
jgi:hypothetical protein